MGRVVVKPPSATFLSTVSPLVRGQGVEDGAGEHNSQDHVKGDQEAASQGPGRPGQTRAGCAGLWRLLGSPACQSHGCYLRDSC